MKWRVVLIGSGNVATSLALALNGKCHLVQVYSRSMASAEALASRVGAQATNDLSQIVTDADIYVISVVDDAITSVLETCPARGGLWVHTSGSTSIDVFKGKRTRYGVLYPMQSFSKSCPARMHEVHIFIEGCDSCATQEVKELAMLLTNNVHEITSTERERLHVAAVFACNFANHMFTLSSEVLDEAGIPFDAMLPLIKTTIAKLDNLTPTQSQTGPAARGDVNVIERHLQSLSGDKHDIYRLLSQSILNRRTR